MPGLTEVIVDDAKRQTLADECLTVVDQEVASKSGVSGLVIKGGYGAVKGIRPGFVRQVIYDLLPEFSEVLQPMYQEAKDKGVGLAPHFSSNAGRVADALLGITDQKAGRSKSAMVKATYDKLRGSAKKNVEAAVPRLSQLVEKYTAE